MKILTRGLRAALATGLVLVSGAVIVLVVVLVVLAVLGQFTVS